MTDIEKHAIVLSLGSAFGGQWFNLSGVIDACRVAGISFSAHPHWPVLSAMHCKRWDAIGEHKAQLLLMVAELLGWQGQLSLPA